jgi:N-acetylmuramoyl-L-alanine amidase
VVAPAEIRPGGPLFALAPLAARLGGELGPAEGGGGGWALAVGGERILFGAGSDVLVAGQEVIRLSQAPEVGAAGLVVPLDFLRATFGAHAGCRFAWDAQRAELTVERGAGRELPVTVDVVNLRGLTTVVLQFPEAPRYRLVEGPGGVEVQLLGDRLAPSPGWRHADPLVTGIDLQRDRISIAFAPGAAADGYTLENPFRLVFDVHRAAAGAEPAPALPAAPPRDAEGVRTIVLDPGHGGANTGAVGASGVEEKELTLLLAQGLKAALERRLPVRVILTRGEDADLPLDTRTAVANQNKADLFVSLHLNSVAGTGNRAHGAETYFLSMQASDARAAQSAELENRAAGEGGGEFGAGGGDDPLHDLQLILWDLAQSHHLAESQRLAALIQEELNGALELADRGVKQAPFRVLMGAAMPAVLVELGFLSNAEEEQKLQDAGYRADLIAALVRAIGRYKAEVDTRAALRRGGPESAEPGAGE